MSYSLIICDLQRRAESPSEFEDLKKAVDRLKDLGYELLRTENPYEFSFSDINDHLVNFSLTFLRQEGFLDTASNLSIYIDEIKRENKHLKEALRIGKNANGCITKGKL